MTLLQQLFSPAPVQATVTSYGDFGWSNSTGLFPSTAGGTVTPETAMKVSTFFAGVRLLSFVVGRLPVGIFKNDTRDQDREHIAYRLLAKRPNATQTPFRFKQWMFSNVLRWGNSYAWLIPDGPFPRLVPIHPSKVTPEPLTSGAVVYRVQPNQSGVPERIPAERMMHWQSPFGDGLEGLSLLSYARETIGGSLGQQDYINRQWSQGLLHKFATKLAPGMTLSTEAKDSLKAQLNDKSGLAEAHRVLVLPGGMELTPMSMSMADAQFLQQEEFGMVQIAQFLGIPPHMLELVDRSTSWGSGIEQQTIGFNVYTMDPWLTELEESIDRDLLDSGATHYSKFNRKALLAADMRSRVAYYRGMASIKAMVPNEIRDAEDMDPVEWGDEPLPSPNESPGGDAAADGENPDPGAKASSQAVAIAEEAAGRLVRKEAARVEYLRKRTNAAEFAAAVREFYEGHAVDVATSMRLDAADAVAYCGQQCSDVVAGRPIDQQETAERLARLALGMEE